jgi:pentapeptide MXKDX repeat protein
MVRTIKTGLALTALAAVFSLQPSAYTQEPMKQDGMKQDKTQDDKIMHEGKAKTLVTGKFHGKAQDGRPGDDLSRDGREAGAAAEQIQDLERAGCTRDFAAQAVRFFNYIKAKNGSQEGQDHHGDANGILMEAVSGCVNSCCGGEGA